MPHSFKIHVDRCVDALARVGVHRKRSAIAEVMAATFGFGSSNEALAADAEGRLDPPQATLVDADGGHGLVVLLDPVANLPFGVAASLLAPGRGTRAADHLPSPYGNLLDVGRLREASPPARPAPAVSASSPPAPVRDARGGVHDLLRDAFRCGASSVTVETTPDGATLSVRVDGHRTVLGTVDRETRLRLLSELRAIARVEASTPTGWDGSWTTGGAWLRVSTSANETGEVATIRIASPGDEPPDLRDLGLTEVASWVRAVDAGLGLFVVTGRSGSGRGRTVRATTARLAASGMRGHSRAPHDRLPPEDVLRSSDYLEFGEVRTERDLQLATMAVDTGGMTIVTMRSLTVEAALRTLSASVRGVLSPLLRGVLAQTLVPTICGACRGAVGPVRCERCGGTGEAGRTALSEVVTFEDAASVAAGIAAATSFRDRTELPWRSMVDDGIDKMAQGVVAFDALVGHFGSDVYDVVVRRGLRPRDFSLPPRP